MQTSQQRTVARITSVLLKGGVRHEGSPFCWAEVEQVRNGTYYVNPIRFKCDGTFSLNATFDHFEIFPIDKAPAEIQAFLNRRWREKGSRRRK